MTLPVDVLIPTYRRPCALAVTLTSLLGQTYPALRIVVSDQTEDPGALPRNGSLQAVLRVLRAHGTPVEVHRHLPRQGIAEQRQYLLDQADAPYVLFMDDDLVIEPESVGRLVRVIREERCGFAGAACIGLSYLHELRPAEQQVELWDGPVQPEVIESGTPEWERFRLHNAANLFHVERQLGADGNRPLRYKVAWSSGCVLFDSEILRQVGGFSFWRDLPMDHAGEDVLVQQRVMAVAGGCGVMPSGVYHQELPTTLPVRSVDAPQVLRR